MSEETPEEQDRRINSMLKDMVVETFVYAIENDEDQPGFTTSQIADYCGCGWDTIKRIEEKALRKVKERLLR